MNIQVHDQYQLFNTATRQWARFEVQELYEYKGQHVVYGNRYRQGIWVPSKFGHVQAPPGPACFPFFPTEPTANITALVDQLRSLPLYLVLTDNQMVPLLTLEDSHKILGGIRGNKDSMIRRAQQLIDLYLEWLPTRLLPEWFRLKKNLVAARN